MIRKVFGIFLALVISLGVFAKSNVTWLETEYDFGLMKEVVGPKTGYARFVNNGPDEVIVLEAHPSCGCTDSTFPEDPVAPGDTASITFTYDPTGRPGRFEKSVRVRFADNERQIIKIRGNVLGAPESLAQFYPEVAGPIRFSERSVTAGNVGKGKNSTAFLNIYNTLSDSIGLRVRTSNPALSVKLSDKHPGPGDISTIAFYFNSAKWETLGPVEIPVELTASVGDEPQEPVILTFMAQVVPGGRSVGAKELKDAPHCAGAPPIVDLGSFDPNSSEPIKVSLNIINDGKSQLSVSNVWSDSKAVDIKKFVKKLKPGKSGTIELEFNPAVLYSGVFRIDVKISTNDPVNPISLITLVGEI